MVPLHSVLRSLSRMATSKAPITPLKDLRVSSHQLPAFGRVPNTSIQRKPLMIYHSAFHPDTSTSDIKSHMSAVGVVEPAWVFPMYRQVASEKAQARS
jgi:hypothetical protein